VDLKSASHIRVDARVNCWPVRGTFDFMKQLSEFESLAPANDG